VPPCSCTPPPRPRSCARHRSSADSRAARPLRGGSRRSRDPLCRRATRRDPRRSQRSPAAGAVLGSHRIGCLGGERGLLGLAFPPDYGASARFYVNFTNPAGDTVVARFKRSAATALLADPASRFDLRWSTGERVIRQPAFRQGPVAVRDRPRARDGRIQSGADAGHHRRQWPTGMMFTSSYV
jgi:hypothetical protein